MILICLTINLIIKLQDIVTIVISILLQVISSYIYFTKLLMTWFQIKDKF